MPVLPIAIVFRILLNTVQFAPGIEDAPNRINPASKVYAVDFVH